MPDINYVALPVDCVSCGACCAYEQKWVEVTPFDRTRLGNDQLLVDGDVEAFAMKTEGEDCRCSALAGVIGEKVICTVYDKRPEVCRAVERGSPKCIYMLGFHRLGRAW